MGPDTADDASMVIRVGLVDDQHLVRSGLTTILNASEGIEVVGEAADGIEAIELARSVSMDVLLMDIRMPQLDGIAATERIFAEVDPAPRICMLTMFEEDELVLDAIIAGASGFLLKDSSPVELRHAITVISSGAALFAPGALAALVAASGQRPARPQGLVSGSLTPREQEIFGLVADGCNNEEIANRLTISQSTVKTHVSRILAKLGLRDRVHVVLYAHGKAILP